MTVEVMDEQTEENGTGQLVSVKMDGQTYEVTQDVADAIDAERVGMDRKLGETSQELGELRKFQRDTLSSHEESNAPEGYDYETAIYNDANAAIRHLKEEIRQEIRDEYLQDQTQRESGNTFWNNFYNENPDLGRSNIKEEVQARIMNELPRYSHLPDNEATRTKMAKDTREYFLGIAKNFSGDNGSQKSNYSEGTGNQVMNMNSSEDDFKRPTTSELLKRNRAKKRQALIDNM